MDTPLPHRLTLETAVAIIDAAFAKGRELASPPLTVAVLDAGARIVALQRQDGASNLRPQIAIAKASGALDVGVSSRKLGVMALERPSFIAALSALAPEGLVPAAGGVLIRGADGSGDRRGRGDRRHL